MARDLKAWLDESEKNQHLLAQEALLLEASEAIWAALDKLKMTKADLARALGSSKANVTQLLDGRRNMTLRTLADIAFTLDLEPHFYLCNKNQTAGWSPLDIAAILGRPSFSSVEAIEAANEGNKWSEPQVLTAEPPAMAKVA